MTRFSIHDGNYFINDLIIPAATMLTLRPNAPVLTGPIITAHYDGEKNIQSDGANQSTGPVPWPAADTLLTDANLAADLESLLYPEPTLDAKKSQGVADINYAAENARNAFITYGSAQALVYEQKGAEAVKYQSDTNPLPANYPLLSAEVGITADTLEGVATIIFQKRTAWLTVAGQIEALRLTAKAQINAAANNDAVDLIIAAINWPKPSA